jgi:DNA (cytosine-5)-methyltransferase 1
VPKPAFTFIDLFAGIGGFHAALSSMGGKCVYAVEIDRKAAQVYERNWGLDPFGDITRDANDEVMNVPPHDVLVAGFPCQPFSKSGAQRGMDETRGTLYWNILKIIETHHPKLVLLENVRNLAGPRHLHEWGVIIETLRAEGYRVAETPAIFSPHLMPRDLGGRPQVRERVFISATYVGDGADEKTLAPERAVLNQAVGEWDPKNWVLETDLPLDPDHHAEGCELTESERYWVEAWNEFVELMWDAREGARLPGFPLWADEWVHIDDLEIPTGTPKWKSDYLVKNAQFYTDHKKVIDRWAKKWRVYTDLFPASRRKLEWQAQDTPRLWDTVMHFRPSGIRAKAPTYLPALVAITQTSIVGSRERRLSTREAARLQGLPEWFDFGDQPAAATYKQLGNGVSVGAVWHVLKRHADRDSHFLEKSAPRVLKAIQSAPENPDEALNHHK